MVRVYLNWKRNRYVGIFHLPTHTPSPSDMWRFSGPFARAGEESLLSCLWSPLSSPLAMSSYILSSAMDVIAPRKPASGSPRIAYWSRWFCEVRRCILIASLKCNFLLLLSHYSPAKALPKLWAGRQFIALYSVSFQILLSPSGDLGISLVWHNLSPPPQLFGPTVEILFKLN